MLDTIFGLAPRKRERMNASIENPSISLSDPNTWDGVFGGYESEAGITVTHRKALTLPPVWQAIFMISGDLAKMPLLSYKRRLDLGTDAKEVDRKHHAYRCVRNKANRETSAFCFWRRLYAHALLWQNGYAYLEFDPMTGDLQEAFNLLPDRTTPIRYRGEKWYLTEHSGPDGKSHSLIPIPAYKIFHLEGLCIDGMAGADLVANAKDSFGRQLAARGFSSKFFKHGSRSGGILELPADMPKEARDTVEEGFTQHHEGPNNWFKTVILRDGAKFHQTTVAPNEGQMTETIEQDRRDTAAYFNLQPSRLGLSDSVSYNSKAEDNQNYLDTTLSPWMTGTTSECHMKLLKTNEQETDSHFFEYDTTRLLQMNPLQRMTMHEIAIRIGVRNPDECRAIENLNPREDGLGKKYVESQNTRPAQAALPAPSSDPPKSNPDDRKQNLVKRRMVYAIGANARHKARNGSKSFLAWLDGGLQTHRAEWTESLGSEPQGMIDDIIQGLNFVVDKVSEDKLAGAVDQAMAVFEERF